MAATDWTQHQDVHAERRDGVVASHSFHGKFPFAVKRPLPERKRAPFWEHLPGKAKAVRTFGSLASAMAAADKAWPL